MSSPSRNVRKVGVLVAGMHRSGTSAVTRLLASLGCDLPKTLMEADSNNAMGYWESTEIADINDAILVSAGSSWDDWEAFNPEWYTSSIAEDFRERARAVLASEFGDSRLFVLKDPRVCRLLQFWKEAIDGIGAEPVVALPVRNPLEVAASLRARDAIDPSIGVLIWLRNVLDAEASSRGLPRAFTRYGDVIDNWKSVATRLGSELEVTWPRRSSVADLEIESFIASSIRHHVHDDARVHDDPMVSRWVRTAFEIFNRWARGEVEGTDLGALDSIRVVFNDCAPNFGRPVAVGRQAVQRNREYEAQVDALDRTAGSLEQAVVGRDRQIADLDKAVRERDQRVADRDRQLAFVSSERDRQVAERDTQIAEQDTRIAEQDTQIADLDKAVRERDQRVADRDRQLAAVSQLLSERDGQVADRDRQLAFVSSERDQQVAERDTRIAERDARIAERDTQIADRDTRIAERDARIAERDAQIAERDTRIAEQDTQIADLDKAVRERDQRVADRDRQLAAVSQLLSERDGQVADRDRQLAFVSSERDRQVAERDTQIAERDTQIAERDTRIAERDTRIGERDTRIGERDTRIGERDTQIADRDARIADRDARIAERDAQIAERDAQIADRDARIQSLDGAIVERDSQIETIYGSASWRITRPLRSLKTFRSTTRGRTGRFLSLASYQVMRFLWRLIPLGPLRHEVKGPLLRLLPGRFIDRHLSQRTQSNRQYVASGRLQLADLNFDAANNQGDTPILFDPEYYLAASEDVVKSGADPLRHYLDHGAVEGRLPFVLDSDEIDPLVETLHRIDLSEDDAFAFDARFYRDLNPDLAHVDEDALVDHYRNHGRAESRAGSRGEFARQICDDPREIPLDFKAAEYIDLYPDLKGYAERSPLEALRHYMCLGRWEPRLHTSRGDAAMASPDSTSIDMPAELMLETRPLCVLAHIYYPDLWEELAGYIASLPESTYDLYVNLVETTCTQEIEQRIRDTFPAASIYVSENVGRDIGGHFRLLRNISMEDYRFFCLIHSKKSPHLAVGDALLWRRRLLTPLLGTPKAAVENLKLMMEDETVGLIGSRKYRDTELRDNAEKFMELLDLLDVRPESRGVEFLSGTMMYLRREVLQRIFETCKDLPFEKGDDTPLRFHLDAQWAHAIERAIGNVVRDMNYRFEWR